MYKIAIVGACKIGIGLTKRFANAGIKVELVDSPERLDTAEENIKSGLKDNIASNYITSDQAKNLVENIVFLESVAEISSDSDFVIETTSGNNIEKIKLFKKIDALTDDKAILITTSLSLNLLSLTQATSRPDKIVSMQFFCPSDFCQYVEFAPSKYTTEFTYSRIESLSRILGLVIAEVRNIPGYCLHRLYLPVLNEAVRLLEIGAADIYTINYAAKDAFKAAKGPFEILNEIGSDNIYKKCNELYDTIGEFYRPTNLLKSVAKSGKEWELPVTPQEKDLVISSEEEYLEIKKHFKALVFKLVSVIIKENITSLNNINLSTKIGLGWKKGPVECMNELSPDLVNSYMDEISLIYPALSAGSEYKNSGEWQISSSEMNINNNIANISLIRPDNKNLLTENLLKEIYFDFERVENDGNIDFITISGSVNAFSVGEDLEYIHKLLCERDFEELNNYIDHGKKVLSKIKNSNKPVVALLEGKVSGAGLSLALSCDFVFATNNTSFSFPEVDSGMIPLFGGITFVLERLDYLLAKYLLITGVELSSEEALSIGLIDNVFSNWSELNSMFLEAHSSLESMGKLVVKPTFEGIKAENILRNAKLFKSVDLLKQRKLISRRAKELMNIVDNKSSDAVYVIEHLIERIKSFELQESLDYESSKAQSYLRYTDILFFLSERLSEKGSRELINT